MITCNKCGNELTENDARCPNCKQGEPRTRSSSAGGSGSQDVFVSPRAQTGNIEQLAGAVPPEGSSGEGKTGPGKSSQDIFISPRAQTGDILQIQNMNLQGMSEEQFQAISSQLNQLLKKAGIPKDGKKAKKMVLTREQKDITAAVLEKLREAEALFGRTVGDPETLIRLGNTEKLTGKLKMAAALYTRALDIFQEREDAKGTILCHNLLGLVYHQQREFDLALEHFQGALRMAEYLEDNKLMALCFRNMSRVHFVRSEYEKALVLFFKGLALKFRRKKKKHRR